MSTATGVAIGMSSAAAMNAAEASSNTDYTIKIEMCKLLKTKEEIFTCFQQLQKEKEHSDNITGIVVVSILLCIIFASFMFWLLDRYR